MNAVSKSNVRVPDRDASPEELKLFYEQLEQAKLAPLWENMSNLAPLTPKATAVPALWRAAAIKEQLETAIRLVSTDKAERRVLILENPAMPGQSAITPSLYSGVQVLAGHERARSHRHTASALRLIIEGDGGYTTVEGERANMKPGDFIITPSWTFHDHGNDADEPVTWLDGLDVFIVNLLNASFGESMGQVEQPITRSKGDAMARYGQGVRPLGYAKRGNGSPLFYYPYERTRRALAAMSSQDGPDDAHGFKVVYADPTTGETPIRSMSAFMQQIPSGFSGCDYRATDGTVYCVVEGSGEIRVGDQHWLVGPHDIFVIPSWTWYSIQSTAGMVLFSFSDRVLQEHLGFWREERRTPGKH